MPPYSAPFFKTLSTHNILDSSDFGSTERISDECGKKIGDCDGHTGYVSSMTFTLSCTTTGWVRACPFVSVRLPVLGSSILLAFCS